MADNEPAPIPAHRHAIVTRSGDAQLIDGDGALRNLDQEGRDAAAAATSKPAPRRAAATETNRAD